MRPILPRPRLHLVLHLIRTSKRAACLFRSRKLLLIKKMFEPELATEWKWLDNTTLNIKLRDDVYFHNGEKMTADDVHCPRLYGQYKKRPLSRKY